MMFTRNRMLALVAGAITCGFAHATPVIDGTMNAAEYGDPVSVQQNFTQFGNSTSGTIDNCIGGSEMNTMFVTRDATNLYIGFGGNVENNFNKMAFFLDSQAGGMNQIGSPVGGGDFGFLSGDGPNPKFQGFTFETGFTADYAFNITNGAFDIFANYFTLGNASYGGDYLGTTTHTVGTLTGGTNNGISATINNINIAGVDGTSAAGASLVRTGAEFKIPLSLIGNSRCDIKVVAMVTGNEGFLSNQFLPSLDFGVNNLLEPSVVNLNNVAGMQMLWLYPSVSGNIDFSDYIADAPNSVDVQWLDSLSNVVATDSISVAPNGDFKTCGPILGGNFNLRIKKSHWLGKVISVNTTNGAQTGASFVLLNGDIDGDNFVGLDDFNILSNSFNLALGDSGYVANADLDGDEFVGLDDFNILSNNFNIEGE